METTRLTKVLLINGEQVKNVVEDVISLDLFRSGRATFVFVHNVEPKGLVEYHCGYQVDNLTPYFLGVIESKHKSNNKWFVTCRELIGALSFSAPIAIRFASAKKVLEKLSKLGISFTTPNADYINKEVPCFYHNGTGITALQQIGNIFNIKNFVFQQRPDGKVYVGSWNDSLWAKSEVNDFAEHPIKVLSSSQGELITVPKLRPGIKLNGRYVTSVILKGSKQTITWSKSLVSK